jgi:hypothetical protein
MARSRPRKAAREKAALARRDLQETQTRTKQDRRLWDLAHEINGANPPDIEASTRTVEEIEEWFEENPSAPMVLFKYPPEEEEGRVFAGNVLISVNARAIERELRARGIDEGHPDWDKAFHLTRETVMTVAQRVATAHLHDGCIPD